MTTEPGGDDPSGGSSSAALHPEPPVLLAGVDGDPIRMRAWRNEDREPFAALNADPEVMQYFPALLSPEQSDALVDRVVAHHAEHGFGLWALQVDGRFAGFVGFAIASFPAPFTPAVEIGWRLARWAWGRAATTAARRALAAAPGFGIDEVLSFTATSNARSAAVMERIGMVRDLDGDFEHPRVPEGSSLRPHVLHRWRPPAAAGGDTAVSIPRAE
ncbi:hypothetical protein GCM10009792_24230 [Microcella alkalica]|uniref:RimJ/RimL family protein N-acetyltransferase n=1 Tax=Microcella alkalica TaxID=355930 RepID=A0A839EA59_9MICO|nr:GNAT family N-acetyltransferase [Microcella alkalica]MBA8848367.1 RimJ/RimL family protein N-acetyltransferase [Microcella alkalica]